MSLENKVDSAELLRLQSENIKLKEKLRSLELELNQKDNEKDNRQWEETFDSISDPLFIHDAKGAVMRANRAYVRAAALPLVQIIGQLYWHVFPKLAAPIPSCCINQGQNNSSITMAIMDNYGSSFLSHRYCVQNSDGKCQYTIHFIQDVSEQLRANHQLEISHQKLSQALKDSIQAIAAAVEMRDPYTAGHQRNVADLGRAIGQRMDLPATQVEGIFFGGIIHDIGKIHLPAEILSWPGKLNALHYALLKEHAEIGYQILKGIDFPWPVAEVARQHHERWDGSGYPQGLKEEEICLEARIIAVADVMEAMTEHRPYRPGLGIEAAMAEVNQGRGVLYDAHVVDACVEVFQNGEYVIKQKTFFQQ